MTSRIPSETTSSPDRGHALAERLVELAGHRVLLAEERVQLPRADSGAQRQLRLPVEGLTVVLDGGHRDQGIRDLEVTTASQRDLVRGHDLLAGDVEHLLTQLDGDDLRRATPFQSACAPGRASPRGARRGRAGPRGPPRPRPPRAEPTPPARPSREVGVLEERATRVDDLDPDLAEDGPQRVETRAQDRLHTAVDADDGPLVVLQVHDARLEPQLARPRDEVELRVLEPGVADRQTVDPQAQERVPPPVDAGTQHALERALPEDETALVLPDPDPTNDGPHGAPSFPTISDSHDTTTTTKNGDDDVSERTSGGRAIRARHTFGCGARLRRGPLGPATKRRPRARRALERALGPGVSGAGALGTFEAGRYPRAAGHRSVPSRLDPCRRRDGTDRPAHAPRRRATGTTVVVQDSNLRLPICSRCSASLS